MNVNCLDCFPTAAELVMGRAQPMRQGPLWRVT